MSVEKKISPAVVNSMDLGSAALWYASHGIAVFPCEPGQKKPLYGLLGGYQNATTDAEQIERWWAAHPDANIGVATGHVFDVIDLDGEEGLNALVEAGGERNHAGPVQDTPSGGNHLLIAPMGRGNGAAIRGRKGIDFRGVGGYIVVAPSINTQKGGRYQWRGGYLDMLPPAPQWFVSLLGAPVERDAIKTRPYDAEKTAAVVELFERATGQRIVERYGVAKVHCLWHEDDTPSLTLYLDEDDPHFHCFGCGRHGHQGVLTRYLLDGVPPPTQEERDEEREEEDRAKFERKQDRLSVYGYDRHEGKRLIAAYKEGRNQ